MIHRRMSWLFLLSLLLASPALAGDSEDKEDQAAREAEERAAEIAEQREKYLEKAKEGNLASLEVEDLHETLDYVVSGVLSQHHLRDQNFNREFGREVLDTYLSRIDPQRQHLLASDVEALHERHDELLEEHGESATGKRVALAFDIFDTYRERLLERIDFALGFIESKPELDGDREIRVDREDADWPEDEDELDEIWKKRIKNDVIGLMLDDRDWEEARDDLERRYNNFRRTMAQMRAEDVFENFLNSHAQTMDPHSAYFSPRDSEEFEIQMSLSLEGIGAGLQVEDEYVTITEILPGGPADEDGTLRPQDRITGVAQGEDGDMKDVIGWRLSDVVDLIRGPEGSEVELRYLPGDSVPGDPEQTLVLERSEVALEEQAASKDIKEFDRNGETTRVGVITIPNFYMDFEGRREGREDYRSTTRDVRRLLEELQEEDVDTVLVDLRNNGGGSLTEATELAGLFLDEGPVVQVMDTQGQLDIAETPAGEAVWDGPMGVMVNRFSASASEIFAGAMQDYGRGVVLGTQTYGKGTVQNLVELDRFLPGEDEEVGQLKFTIGQFYRVSGGSMQHKGVKPDLELPSPISLEDFGESTKPNALEWNEIDGLDYAGELIPGDLFKQLRETHEERVRENLEYMEFKDDVQQARKMSERETLSLNLDERREEHDEARERRLVHQNLQRQAQGEEPLEELEEDDEELDIEQDILLSEATRIMADFSALLRDYTDDDVGFAARKN